jgi:hypothetical protein
VEPKINAMYGTADGGGIIITTLVDYEGTGV